MPEVWHKLPRNALKVCDDRNQCGERHFPFPLGNNIFLYGMAGYNDF